jgi:hypothetical protein
LYLACHFPWYDSVIPEPNGTTKRGSVLSLEQGYPFLAALRRLELDLQQVLLAGVPKARRALVADALCPYSGWSVFMSPDA